MRYLRPICSIQRVVLAVAAVSVVYLATPVSASWFRMQQVRVASSVPVSSLPSVSSPPAPGQTWSNQTAASLSQLADSDFAAISADELASIPAAACAICSGFTPACFQNILTAALSGLSSSCAMALTPSVVGAMTPAQVVAWPRAVCSIVSVNQTAALSAGACAVLPSECLSVWSSGSMAGWTSACLTAMSATQMASFSTVQIAVITPAAAAGFTPDNVALMGTSCAGISAKQVPFIDGLTFGNWSELCSLSFLPESLSAWSRVQMRDFTPRYLWEWSVQQIAHISDLGASGISPAMAHGFTGPVAYKCSAFHASQIAMFRDFYDQIVCEQWKPDCFGNITASEFTGLQQLCIQRLQPDTIHVLTAAQVGYIQPTTFAALLPNNLAAFSPAAMAGVTAQQLSLLDQTFPAETCRGFSAAQFAQLNATILPTMAPQCAAHLPAGVLANASNEQIAALVSAPSVWGALSRDAAASLTPQQCATLSGASVSALGTQLLPYDAVTRLSAACLATFGNSTCSTLSPSVLQAFERAAPDVQQRLGALQPACLASLQSSFCEAANATFFDNIDADKCASLSAACVGGVSAAAAAAMSPKCVQQLQPGAFKALDKQAFEALSSEVFAALTSAQVAELTPAQCSWAQPAQLNALKTASSLTSTCVAMLNNDVCSGASAELIAQVNGTACPGFTVACFANFTDKGAAGFTPDCMASVLPGTLSALNDAAFQALPASVFAGLSAETVHAFTPRQCVVISADDLNALSGSTPVGLTPVCLAHLVAPTCAHVGVSFWQAFNRSNVTLSHLAAVDPSCVRALDCATVTGVQVSVLAHFNATAASARSDYCATHHDDDPDANHTLRNVLIGVGVGVLALIIIGLVWRWCTKRQEHKQRGVQADHHAYMQAPEDM